MPRDSRLVWRGVAPGVMLRSSMSDAVPLLLIGGGLFNDPSACPGDPKLYTVGYKGTSENGVFGSSISGVPGGTITSGRGLTSFPSTNDEGGRRGVSRRIESEEPLAEQRWGSLFSRWMPFFFLVGWGCCHQTEYQTLRGG